MSNPISHQPLAGSILSHHVHSENEPLPGAKGAAPAVDYTPDTIEHVKLPPSEEGATQFIQNRDTEHHTETPHKESPNYQAAYGVNFAGEHRSAPAPVHGQTVPHPQHTNAGLEKDKSAHGHAGSETHPEHHDPAPAGKVKLGDKIVGKTQEIAGKVIHNDALKEKGELRKQGEAV